MIARRSAPAQRLVWAVDTMAVRPGDRLLEIGCGHGIAVSLVCEQLDGGHILAIDRSAKMIEAARRRNARHVSDGTATFEVAALHGADLGHKEFNTIFAVHVPVFTRGKPDRELRIVGAHLAPGGRLYLPFQPLVRETVEPTLQGLAAVVTTAGFTVLATPIADLSTARVGCVIAQYGG